MKTAILACRTLKRELIAVMNSLGCSWPVYWLEAGAHNHPHKRRQEIQEALLQCRDYDRVLLAMAYCGGALEGVRSDSSTLVLPCCDDCIVLLLGTQGPMDHYFLTRGWLEGKDNLHREYQRTRQRYGKEKTDRIFRSMLKNYRYLAYIPGPGEDPGAYKETIHAIANDFGLEAVILPGNDAWLRELLSEDPSPDRFRILSPGTPISREMKLK